MKPAPRTPISSAAGPAALRLYKSPDSRPKLLCITTVPLSLWCFFEGQFAFLKSRGFDVQALASPGELLEKVREREQIAVHAIEMPRRITPLQDLLAVTRLWRKLRLLRPDIVHAHTPKGGLLGMLAAWLARAPVRIYHIHGLPLMTAKGFKRRLLSWSEKVSCRLAHRVLCVSHSIADVVEREGLCPAAKFRVLGGGTINGVDARVKFNPRRLVTTGRAVRLQYGIPDDATVVGFVGRIVRDKGIVELVAAWIQLREEFPALHLMLVGPLEPQDPLPAEAKHVLHSDPRVHVTGQVPDAAPLYAAMDLCVLPSYREGFPGVPLEAAAMGLPVVATSVPGCIDAVLDGVTGTLVPAREAQALAGAIRGYVVDSELRAAHGEAGRARASREFGQQAVWQALLDEYCELLAARNLPLPLTGISEPTLPVKIAA